MTEKEFGCLWLNEPEKIIIKKKRSHLNAPRHEAVEHTGNIDAGRKR